MFITFEGIDFCGKSTQVELLKNYFEKKGKTVKVIREPGGTEISEKIRDILLDKKNNKMFMETELLLFSASRAQLVREKIIPFLKEGSVVISDRFHDSSTAYQGFGRGLPVEAVLNVHKLAIGETIPDITFIIDIPVSVAVERKALKTHQELDRIEVSSNDFFEKVRNGYLSLAKNEKRFRIINGTKSIEEIHKLIINYIEDFEQS
ncbi:Thymidylate kinase [Ignavibacterium album JCM 16511]|uniref:Thymidylate kinase n=1 Tax=Ignavibacterium album (strain DSM 19864 / JCM 16511 / NBRC 101810 / Mat9-16) TaxID=945713 RepID=I0AJD6_IGNAJ|nr:dTMP kinase [Ignavibacterium album]AFH49093.1 Thymidylate kinase [Ignavibacterium album JCM 16511]